MLGWLHDRALTLVLMAMFLIFLAAQYVTGLWQYNESQLNHDQPQITAAEYFTTGHWWEAVFENWESEFLQMAVFVLLTTMLVQKGSPESRRAHSKELVDANPRDFADRPNVPWPVRRGGWILDVYENSLGLAFVFLFLISWVGHAIGGYFEFANDQVEHGAERPEFMDYVTSSRFWFESFQNWQSEFFSIAAMVWLAVYLRQRHSPESKPVHASHDDHD
jgi:hypothetical protein